MNPNDLIHASTSALSFMLVGMLLTFVFSDDPDVLMPLVGSVAWFVATLVLRVQTRASGR